MGDVRPAGGGCAGVRSERCEGGCAGVSGRVGVCTCQG